MSEALGALYEWCAARHRQFRRGFAASGCMVDAQCRMSNVLTRIRLVRRSRIRTFTPAVDLGIVREI